MASLEAAFTGAVASSVANVVVYPLDLAKTLLQTQLKQSAEEFEPIEEKEKYDNTLDCILKVYKKRGLSGLYQGMSTSVLANFIQSFCYFFWYTLVRKYYFRLKLTRAKFKGNVRFSTIEELLLGMVAAATSQLFTNPISVISTRQQTIDSKGEGASTSAIVKQILKENNGDIRGLWRGLKVSLVLTINPSITYASYQELKRLMFSIDDFSVTGQELSARQNFSLGVLSKMISTVITQPLIISKVSLQRAGSHFTNFQQVMFYLYKNEGLLSLWKGLRPQLAKGVLVQGLLFMFKGELTKILRKVIFLYSNFLIKRH